MGAEWVYGKAVERVFAAGQYDCGDAARWDSGVDAELGAHGQREPKLQRNGDRVSDDFVGAVYRLRNHGSFRHGGWGVDGADLPIELRKR